MHVQPANRAGLVAVDIRQDHHFFLPVTALFGETKQASIAQLEHFDAIILLKNVVARLDFIDFGNFSGNIVANRFPP